MQISEKSIQDTIDCIIGSLRRESLECFSDFMLDDSYWHTRSKLEGLRLLFIEQPGIIARIDAAMLETEQSRAAGKARLASGQMAA